jgi:hypothetical protein
MSRAFHHVLSRLNQAANGPQEGRKTDTRTVRLDDLRQLLNDWNRLDDLARTADKAYAEVWEKARALQSEMDAALRNAEALQLNADRYVWLRDPDTREGLEPEDCIVVGIAEGEDIVWLEQLDQAIDVNMGDKP